VIGSSNWTASALSRNTELNVQIESSPASALSEEIREEFDFQFDRATPLTEEFIAEYEDVWRAAKEALQALAPASSPHGSPTQAQRTLQPNRMQQEALRCIQALRDQGEDKERTRP